jgi:hypothetical protein
VASALMVDFSRYGGSLKNFLRHILLIILINNLLFNQKSQAILRNRAASTAIDQRFDNLDQYNGRILIGGELEKFSNELFEDVTFDEALTNLEQVIDMPFVLDRL